MTARLGWATGVVVIAIAVAVVSLVAAWQGIVCLDDAFIVMVYARHWVQGDGFYWNLADGHLEGFTSLLDVLVKGVVYGASGNLTRTAIAVTWLYQLGFGLVCFASVRRWAADAGMPARRAWAVGCAAVLVVGSTPAVACGSAFLLETPLYVGLGVAVVTLVLARAQLAEPGARSTAALVIASLLFVLARPEALVLAPSLLLFDRAMHPPARGARRSWSAIALVALGVAGLLCWRRVYFGSWHPNSYYAKTSDLRINEIRDGIVYILQYARSAEYGPSGATLLFAAFFALPLAWRGWPTPTHAHGFRCLTGAAMLSMALVVMTGGDSYPGGRFLALGIVWGALAVFYAAIHGAPGVRRLSWVFIALLGVVHLGSALFPFRWSERDAARGPRTAYAKARLYQAELFGKDPASAYPLVCDVRFAEWLTRLMPNGTFAQTDYSRLKAFADEITVIDLQGLNDRAIAHVPWSVPVRYGKKRLHAVIERAPDAFVFGFAYRQGRTWTDQEIHDQLAELSPADQDAVRAAYVPVSVPVCETDTVLYLRFVLRRALAERPEVAGLTREW